MKDNFNFVPEDEDYDIDFYPDSEEEDCPYMSLMASIALNDKPFGILWPKDKIQEFLKARGYKILSRKNNLVQIFKKKNAFQGGGLS